GASARRGDPVTTSEREVVAALGRAIAQRVGEPRYKLWFDRHTKFTWEEGLLTVGVPNRHFEEWLHKTFGAAVADAAREVFGQPMQVRFTIDPELFQAARREQVEVQGRGQEPAPADPAPETRKRRSKAEEPKPAPKAAAA